MDLWSDTTTLYTHILKGHLSPEEDSQDKVLASGTLGILLLDFAQQLSTLFG